MIFIFQIGIGQKTIILEDVFEKGIFSQKSVSGFNFMKDGRHFTKITDGKIVKYDIKSGESVGVLLDLTNVIDNKGISEIENYTFSEDETKILIESETENIYRHSSAVKAYVYDVNIKSIIEIYPHGKVINPQFSPNGEMVAYVVNNNLFYTTMKNQNVTQITKDGQQNSVINGLADWVYEEEFSFTRAFYWSPDSKKIAFLRFDEGEVMQYTLQYFTDDLYPINYTYKYPKVGEKNAIVSAHIFNFNLGKAQKIELEDKGDVYIPRMKWTDDPNNLCVTVLNRHQNHLKLFLVNTRNLNPTLLYEEKNKYYLDVNDHLTFLNGNKYFLLTSEQDGYNRIIMYNMEGKLVEKVSPADMEVTTFHGVDQKNSLVYFEAIDKNPLENQTYSIQLNGKSLIKLTKNKGSHHSEFSNTFDYYIDRYSTINMPTNYTVYDRQGNLVRTIEDNKKVQELQKTYEVSDIEFFSFTTSENVKLNGWMLKPRNFNPNKKHPVFMTQYSGPGSQSVTDSWQGTNYWWYQLLAQNGYVVACVDGRGTGGRGEEFKKMTYLKLGHYETLDQIETAKYLGNLPYVDKNRIGIFGWSYGGYMSSLCLLKGNDVFKAGIAVAPVTNWKWYDSVYTERYMRTVEENQEGYAQNSPVYFADRLKGSYLLVHGLADDNVHFQHSAEMANALIKAKKQFDTYYYPNRNHGIYGDNARIHLFSKITDFIFEKI
ncbi:MAG: S9 family peptidase [Saprospiraceae bacterium]